jgi:hypothetical protein
MYPRRSCETYIQGGLAKHISKAVLRNMYPRRSCETCIQRRSCETCIRGGLAKHVSKGGLAKHVSEAALRNIYPRRSCETRAFFRFCETSAFLIRCPFGVKPDWPSRRATPSRAGHCSVFRCAVVARRRGVCSAALKGHTRRTYSHHCHPERSATNQLVAE